MQPTAAPLLLLGGTFDPPHLGHLVLAECARTQFASTAALPSVLFLPAGDPYRKASRFVSPALHRLAMTRLAVASNPNFVVDDREVRREGPSYTVDTLEELHSEGHANLILLLGTDAIADMPNWKQPERIRELATIAVAPKADGSAELPGPANTVFVTMPLLPISSTLIRSRAVAGLPIRYLVPDSVEAYIREHGLYRTRGA
ncbi:MAG: nicotinate-nucleotide adenylyltransferase [Tepidiformaceae bacterium]